MLVDRPRGLPRDVHHLHCVYVRVDSFVAHYQFLDFSLFAPNNCNVSVCYIQFIFVFKEKVVLFWIIFIESYHEHSQFSLIHVAENVEILII